MIFDRVNIDRFPKFRNAREKQVMLLSGYELVDLTWPQVLSLSEVILSFIVMFVPFRMEFKFHGSM